MTHCDWVRLVAFGSRLDRILGILAPAPARLSMVSFIHFLTEHNAARLQLHVPGEHNRNFFWRAESHHNSVPAAVLNPNAFVSSNSPQRIGHPTCAQRLGVRQPSGAFWSRTAYPEAINPDLCADEK